MTSPTEFSELISDRRLIEGQLRILLRNTVPDGGPVNAAMRYAVLGSGQRIRPLIALRTARLLGLRAGINLRAGACVELLHCASLIIDDLPCMDNEMLRRNRPSVHVKFGEATAILAAFALVALSARSLAEFPCDGVERRRVGDFQTHLLRTLDVGGLIAGQSLDLELSGTERELYRDKMAGLKTVPLFVLAVRAGLLLAEMTTEQETLLIDFAHRYGSAYQMTDDLLDGEQSNRGRLTAQLEHARCCLRPFGSQRQELEELVDYLHDKTREDDHRHR